MKDVKIFKHTLIFIADVICELSPIRCNNNKDVTLIALNDVPFALVASHCWYATRPHCFTHPVEDKHTESDDNWEKFDWCVNFFFSSNLPTLAPLVEFFCVMYLWWCVHHQKSANITRDHSLKRLAEVKDRNIREGAEKSAFQMPGGKWIWIN